jgi:hypothetical protein
VRLGPGWVFEATARPGTSEGPARYLHIVQFNGPRPAEWVAAHEFAGRERIDPAVRDLPQVATMHGRTDDGGAVTLVLTETIEVIDEAVRRIMATTLLPGERPELLTGPDRTEVQRLVHADLPESVFGVAAAPTEAAPIGSR